MQRAPVCSRHLVLAIIVSLPALGAARTMPRTRRRAILLLFVSARSHLAEQGLHLCAERKFVRAAQRKGAGGPARSCRGLCLGKCPFWLCSDGARFWVCTAPHLSANLLGLRARSSRGASRGSEKTCPPTTRHPTTATHSSREGERSSLCEGSGRAAVLVGKKIFFRPTPYLLCVRSLEAMRLRGRS